jgi:hypothetical protein
VTLAAGEYFVVCANAATVANCDLDVSPDTDLIQNGAPDALALVQGATLVDVLSYEGDTAAPYTEGSGAGLVDTAATGEGLSRCADGLDTDQNNVDFSLRANTPGAANACGGDQPPTVTSTSPANGATSVSTSANVVVTFSEDVSVTASAFSLTCVTSGAHALSVSGGPQSFTLDPSVDFAFSESCTGTVVAAEVSDQDGTADPMAANYVFSFTTAAAPFGACGDAATAIHTVQGSGATSPLAGTSGVQVEGVVTGDYQAPGQLGGFFVQEEDGQVDADPATSEGLFVFNTSFPVQVGDLVRVRGNVVEFSTGGVTLTELTSVTDLTVCGSGNSVSAATVLLPVTSLGDWEAFEGMLVELPQDLTVTDNFTLGRFGEVGLSVNGRLAIPTAVAAPGAAALARQDLNDRSRILLDDGNGQQNIDPTLYPAPGLSATNTLRSGDTLDGLLGVLEQRFGVYRIQPVGPLSFTASNPRPGTPPAVGGRIRVGAMNTLNYFTTLDTGAAICGPAANLGCRGADDAFELARQRAKLVSAIAGLDADVVGLMELENDGGTAIQDLVAGLNAIAAAGEQYDFVNTGTIGTDAIKVGLLYRPDKVSLSGAHAILDSSVDPAFLDTLNRPVLAQTFAEAGTGETFTVAVAHLKSKGSDCNAVGDPDTGDGQGNCNLTRTSAATALASWLADDPTGSGDPDFLVLGDLNSYAKEDPIAALEGAGFVNLIDTFAGDSAYSFVFGGQSGYLDHALASAGLADQATGAAEWHANADEPNVLDYNVEFKSANHVTTLYDPGPFRSADHDPLVVGLDLDGTPPELSVEVTPEVLRAKLRGRYVTVRATVNVADLTDPNPQVRLVSVTSSEPDDAPGGWDGFTKNDIVIVDDRTFKLRAELSLRGPGRIYTITYEAEDAGGNTVTASALVRVPAPWRR